MGFTTGLLGGATLTYSILYLSLYFHQANRNVQHTLLSQQSILLNSVVEPLPRLPEAPAYEVRKAGLAEQLKDRWNAEIAALARNVQTTDWGAVRERVEQGAGTVWARVRNSDTGQRVASNVQEGVQASQRMATEAKDSLLGTAKDIQQATESQPAGTGGRRLLELKE